MGYVEFENIRLSKSDIKVLSKLMSKMKMTHLEEMAKESNITVGKSNIVMNRLIRELNIMATDTELKCSNKCPIGRYDDYRCCNSCESNIDCTGRCFSTKMDCDNGVVE